MNVWNSISSYIPESIFFVLNATLHVRLFCKGAFHCISFRKSLWTCLLWHPFCSRIPIQFPLFCSRAFISFLLGWIFENKIVPCLFNFCNFCNDFSALMKCDIWVVRTVPVLHHRMTKSVPVSEHTYWRSCIIPHDRLEAAYV